MTITHLLFLLFGFLLHYTPCMLSMIDFSNTWKYRYTAYKTQLPSPINDCPKEVISLIMHHLSLKECAAFTATCKRLHARLWQPREIDINPNHIKKESEFRNNMRQRGLVSAGLVGCSSCLLPESVCRIVQDNYECSKEMRAFLGGSITICLSGCMIAHILIPDQYNPFKKVKNWYDDYVKKDHTTTIAKTDTYLTEQYRILAEQMAQDRVVPHTLKVHYHNKKQIGPLLDAAKHSGVIALNIYLCGGDIYSDVLCCGDIQHNGELNLHTFLDNNKHLTHLTIEGDPSRAYDKTICVPGFCLGLHSNNDLTRLTLGSFSENALQEIIHTINTKATIKELTITDANGCNPLPRDSWIPYLADNKTLKKFTLIDCALDDHSAHWLHHFMAWNSSLQSLCIFNKRGRYVKSIISDEAKALLYNSPHKPHSIAIEEI